MARAAVGETTLFVVRVWRETDGFRAAVRRVDDEDTRLFDSTADVAHYLELSASGAADPLSRLARRPGDEPTT